MENFEIFLETSANHWKFWKFEFFWLLRIAFFLVRRLGLKSFFSLVYIWKHMTLYCKSGWKSLKSEAERELCLDFTDFIYRLLVITILCFNCTYFMCNFKILIFVRKLYTFLFRSSRIYLYLICNHLQCMVLL